MLPQHPATRASRSMIMIATALAIVILAGPALSEPIASTRLKLDGPLRFHEHSSAAKQLIKVNERGEKVIPLIIEGPIVTGALRAAGIQVNTDVAGLRTARVPESALATLLSLPGVTRLSMGVPLKPHLSVSVPTTNADDKRTTFPPPAGWNGKDVIVGIVDTGVDYDHADFKDEGGNTRILNIWDQNVAGVPPSGFGYGHECSQAQIQAGTCSASDPAGHGSHVTGIAAGDGSATGNGQLPFRYVGMANDADIIVVATDFSFAGVVDAVNYIFQKASAAGKAAVVNLSLGTESGPHDGTMSWEQQLDALTGPGKIIVASAGNTQDDNVHASADIQASRDSFRVDVSPYTPNTFAGNDFMLMDGWHDDGNSYNVSVRTPSDIVVGPVVKGAFGFQDTGDGRVIIDYTFTNNPNGQSNIYFEINDDAGPAPSAGTYYLIFDPVNVPLLPKMHAWMVAQLGSALPAFPLFASHVDLTVNIGTPGSAHELVTVASYATRRFWNAIDGGTYNFTDAVDPFQISPYSAAGPDRAGSQKPDITAPGSAIISVLSADASPPYPNALIATDGKHLVLQGTSMAAPHVTGAVAMLLQNDPTMTPDDVKQELDRGAVEDTDTGTTPNFRWGSGKLNVWNLLCDLDEVDPLVDLTFPLSPEDTLYMTTRVSIGWDAIDNSGVTAVDLDYRIGLTGGWIAIAQGIENQGWYPFDVPNILTDSLEVRVRAADCLNNDALDYSGWVRIIAPSVDVAVDLPLAFAAYKPAPNPFSAHSTIRFDLPSAGESGWPVSVALYNVAGRKIRTLVDGNLPGGRYSYQWDGRDNSGVKLAAGVYFLQIKAGPNEAKDRIVFMR
jgi:subtilisin family serine protease